MKNPLDNSLGFQLVIAARSMKRALELKLNKHGITSSQYTVLEVLWKHNSLSLSDLGKILHFDNPTITGIIDRMARDKLIKRSRDRTDRRVIKIHLTPKGQSLQSVLPELAHAVNIKAVEDFQENEKAIILNLTKRLHKNLISNS